MLTAGHCAYDETRGAFATNWMFVPEYDSSPSSTCANTEHGCFTAVALVVHQGYAGAGGFNIQAIKHDWAFAVVGAGSQGGQLDVKVPDFPIGFDAAAEARHAFGYPSSGRSRAATSSTAPATSSATAARTTPPGACAVT